MFREIVERMNERIDGVGSVHNEDQGVCLTSVKVPSTDWRIYLVLLRIFNRCGPRGRVRWIRPPSSTDVGMNDLFFFFSNSKIVFQPS